MFIAPLSFAHGLFDLALFVNAGNSKKPRVSKRLLALLEKMEKEKSPEKRASAYATLMSLLKHSREKNIVLVLIKKLNAKELSKNSDNHFFCSAVIELLGEMRDKRATPILLKWFKKIPQYGQRGHPFVKNFYDVEIKKSIANALAKIKDHRAVPDLIAVGLAHQDEKVREASAVALVEIADEKVVRKLENAAKDTLRTSGNWEVIARIIEVFKKAVKKTIDKKYNQYKSIIKAGIIVNSQYLTASRHRKQQIISQLRRKIPARLISVLLRQGARGFNMQILSMLPLDLRRSFIAKKRRGEQTVKALRIILNEIEASKNKEYSQRICELPSSNKAFCNIIKEVKRRAAGGAPVYIGQPPEYGWGVKGSGAK